MAPTGPEAADDHGPAEPATEGHATTDAQPAADDADTVPRPAGSPDASEPDTSALPPRWTGSAAVRPPGTRRRRRRFGDEDETWPVDVPPPRSPDDPPTLEWPAPPPTEVWPATSPPGPAGPHPGAGLPPGPARPWPPGGQRPVGPPMAGPLARPPAPVRPPSTRRRRWPWVLLVLGVLSVLCCCGCAGLAWPYLRQYPTTVTLPARAAGLSRLDDADSRQVEAQLKVKLRTEQLLAEGVFAGRYAVPGDESAPVTLFGTTGFHLSPDKDLDAALSGLTDQLALTGVRTVPAGDLGGFERCGSGESDGTAITVCGWADHGSLAIGLFPRRDLDQGAQLLRELRAAVTHRANRAG